jgi:hypothetical protein
MGRSRHTVVVLALTLFVLSYLPYQSYGLTCVGNNNVFTLSQLQNCTQFTALTASTTLLFTGSDVLSLQGLSNVTFDNWPGPIYIVATSIRNLSGLESIQSVGTLVVSNNTYLTEIKMFPSSINDLQITRNPQLQIVVFPLLSSLGQLEIQYNDNLSELSGFNSITSLYNLVVSTNTNLKIIGFNTLNVIFNQLTIQGNVYNTSGFSALQTVQQLTIRNADKIALDFPKLNSVTSALFVNLSNVMSLDFLSAIPQIQQLEIQNCTHLYDYSALHSLNSAPAILDFSGSCCPKYSFFNAVWMKSQFTGCIPCVSYVSQNIDRTPIEGGLFYYIYYNGSIINNNVMVSLNDSSSRSAQLNCSVDSSKISCITASFSQPTNVSITIQIDDYQFTISDRLQYMALQDYLGQSLDTQVTIINNQDDIPGLPASNTTQTDLWTYAILGSFGGCCIIIILILSITKGKSRCGKMFRPCDVYKTTRTLPESDKIIQGVYGDRMYERKTTFGGMLTIISVIAGFFLVLLLSYIVSSSNTVASEAIVLKRQRLSGNYFGTIQLINYPQACDSSSLSVAVNGFISTAASGYFNYTFQRSSLPGSDKNCIIDWNLYGVDFYNAYINLNAADPNAYALGVSWVLYSYDYFGNPIKNFGSMNGGIYKGSGSNINILTTVSHFSQGSQVLHGIIPRVDSVTTGTVNNFQDAQGLGVRMQLTMNQLDYNIELRSSYSVFSIITILGSIASFIYSTGRFLSATYHRIRVSCKPSKIVKIPETIEIAANADKV